MKLLPIDSEQKNDTNDLSMKENLIRLHRIVLKYSYNSNKALVETDEYKLFVLIENSIRINQNNLFFKIISYFIRKHININKLNKN